MHGSAHDKAPRRRGVLRRGKCVQHALRGVVTRLRKRRTLVATAALVLLVLALLTLCHARLLSRRPAHRDGAHDNAAADAVADDSTSHVAASPSDRWLLRPDTPHGGSVRVMLLMVSTRADEQLCYALASAYFADLPVVVLGYGGEYKSHIWRWQVYLDAIERAGLRDRDVVLLLDSDILFSGEDMLPFIDDYIARSPAAPSALDVRAVRAGTARAPSMFAAECKCWFPQLVLQRSSCVQFNKEVDDVVATYVARTGVAYDLHNASVQPLRYLNGGVSIHRVWSARELAKTLQHYVATQKPQYNGAGWWCDQSVFALFYNDLRAWEVEHDVLRNSSTAAAATQRGPHGLRAGQLQLEQTGRLSMRALDMARIGEVTDELWASHAVGQPNSSAFRIDDLTELVQQARQRYGDSVRLQQRTLTRAGNGTHTIDLTPPLLRVPQMTSRVDATRPTVVYPLIYHFSGKQKRLYMKRLLQVLQWHYAVTSSTARWQQARAQVLSTEVKVWTAKTNATRRVPYITLCQQRHPFLLPTP